MADYDDKIGMDEKELLQLVKSEMQTSIGFEYDAELVDQRERAMNYSLGKMYDVPALVNRSRAVSTDVADAIETALPDIVEILSNGDVLAFAPQGEEDEEQAEQETDYLHHVFFNENDGFGNIYTYIKDALQSKTGMFTWWWDEGEEPAPKSYENKTAIEAAMLIQSEGEKNCSVTKSDDVSDTGEVLYDVIVSKEALGRAVIAAFDPNDFTICRDATCIDDATYCARRSRPRAQDLIAQGIDKDIVDMLPPWNNNQENAAQLARDTVAESTTQFSGTNYRMRQVLVVEHYIRLYEDGKNCIYQMLTNWDCTVVLRTAKVNRINIAAGKPYINTHRFYGESLADKLIEVQRIKTMLTRMTLDAGAFAINQRPYVNMNNVNDFTIQDLLNNIPGAPVRGDGDAASTVQMLGGPALNYDPLEQIEYFSTVGESRSGIVRNAQGLNPDTLHDTMGGAAILMGAAQKRLRLIVRILAEGLKDAYLGVHATLLENASQDAIVKLRNKWVPVNPSSWQVRNDMTIEVGQGAANSQHDLLVAQTLGGMAEKLFEAQGMTLNGPLINAKSLNAIATDTAKALGKKDPQRYFPNPDEYKAPPEAAPPPDPALLKVQADAENNKAQLEADNQYKQQQLQMDQQRMVGEAYYKQQELELRQRELEMDDARQHKQLDGELALKEAEIAAKIQMKEDELQAKFSLDEQGQLLDVHKHKAELDNDIEIASSVKPGGEAG